ncbi:heterogeneous nuclear ribonucleoprotein Q-like [Asparagus officinalis]|uniref:heterogeneous nuclear ribonucleoprotein Q-like n=1 Tax=Asparagus officinalis TaxID=4686 RepID=UPI00098E1FCA|nr:heterogeneous nuclear ribonucleoprotein Q-like [Asparagus officinalis]
MEAAEEIKKEEEEEEEAVKATYPKEEQQDVENPNNEDASVPMETVQETATADSEKVEDVTKEEEGGDLEMEVAGNMEAGSSESKSRKKTEIFIGGLDRDAKEEDLRKVFGEVGEIVEVRMIMDGQSGKNKGYAFVRYADASQAKKAVAQFEKVEVCGKLCGASALKGNDTIFLGNIDKKWKKDDIVKFLQEIGIEKIEAVTVMPDSSNADSNRGFALVELETNKDAVNAYKKLQKKDAFGKGRSIKVDWAEPLDDPDEEEMKKVKSVYAEGIPDSWDEEKVREPFKKFGEIERIVLARNIKSSKRKDFAFVNYQNREAALSCIESFDKEELTDNGSKVTVKVSLAKPGQKGKQSKGGPNFSNKNSVKGTPKAFQRNSKTDISFRKGKSSGGGYSSSGHVRSSTNYEPLHASREQPPWRQGQVGYTGGPSMHGYRHGAEWKRPFSSLGDDASYSDFRGYPRPRVDSFPSSGPSHGGMPHGTAGPPHPYYQRQGAGYPAGAPYGSTEYPATHQVRPGAPSPYGNSYYPRY